MGAADTGEQCQRVGEVIFSFEQDRVVLDLRPTPGLGDITPAIGRGWDVKARGNQERARWRLEPLILADGVKCRPEPFALIVERYGADIRLSELIVQRRIALVMAAIEPDAELAIRAKPPADIEMSAPCVFDM